MATSVTRQRLSWNGLTERSAWNSGDIIDVWCDDDLFRGVYCGLTFGHDGRIRAEVESLESVEEWRFYDLGEKVTIKLVQPSRQLPGPVVKSCEYLPIEDDDKPLPLSAKEKRFITLAIVGGCLFWGMLFIWAFGR